MSEQLLITSGNKEQRYALLLEQIRAMAADEADLIARMANASSMIHETFHFWWTGFYRAIDNDTLVLGPFQGPLACTRIRKGRGVCGMAWQRGESVLVDDVDQFPGHIACSSASRSEIVVPLRDHTGHIIGVLDIDSEHLATFDQTDRLWLERIADIVANAPTEP